MHLQTVLVVNYIYAGHHFRKYLECSLLVEAHLKLSKMLITKIAKHFVAHSLVIDVMEGADCKVVLRNVQLIKHCEVPVAPNLPSNLNLHIAKNGRTISLDR